jgi:peroxiredoxin Q/BCP
MLTSFIAAGVLTAGLAMAQAPTAPAQAPSPAELQVGDPAPAFALPGSDGMTHTLAEHAGKRAVVVAWFPKAFTGG